MNSGARGLRGPAMPGAAGGAPVVAVDPPARPEGSRLANRQDGAGGLGEILSEAKVRLERAESLLLHPSALSAAQLIAELEECCRLLAGTDMGALSAASGAPGITREGRDAAMEWRRSLTRLEQLTAGAASFCHGWAAASGLAGGYTAAGTGDLQAGGGVRMDHTG